MKLTISLVLLGLSVSASAKDNGWLTFGGAVAPATACPVGAVCLAWIKPSGLVDKDGKDIGPIPADKVPLVMCHIYRASQEVWLVPCVNEQQIMPNQPRGTQCYVMTASLDAGVSDPSNTRCKKVGFPGPTDGKIEAPTDGSIQPK